MAQPGRQPLQEEIIRLGALEGGEVQAKAAQLGAGLGEEGEQWEGEQGAAQIERRKASGLGEQ